MGRWSRLQGHHKTLTSRAFPKGLPGVRLGPSPARLPMIAAVIAAAFLIAASPGVSPRYVFEANDATVAAAPGCPTTCPAGIPLSRAGTVYVPRRGDLARLTGRPEDQTIVLLELPATSQGTVVDLELNGGADRFQLLQSDDSDLWAVVRRGDAVRDGRGVVATRQEGLIAIRVPWTLGARDWSLRLGDMQIPPEGHPAPVHEVRVMRGNFGVAGTPLYLATFAAFLIGARYASKELVASLLKALLLLALGLATVRLLIPRIETALSHHVTSQSYPVSIPILVALGGFLAAAVIARSVVAATFEELPQRFEQRGTTGLLLDFVLFRGVCGVGAVVFLGAVATMSGEIPWRVLPGLDF